MESYLDFIPIDIINIFVSKLDIKTFNNFIETYPKFKNLNYLYIASLIFPINEIRNTFQNVGYEEYKIILSTFIINKKLGLRMDLRALYNKETLDLTNIINQNIPKDILNLVNLKKLTVSINQYNKMPIDLIRLLELRLNLKVERKDKARDLGIFAIRDYNKFDDMIL
jgi:hypothetical protein